MVPKRTVPPPEERSNPLPPQISLKASNPLTGGNRQFNAARRVMLKGGPVSMGTVAQLIMKISYTIFTLIDRVQRS
uniref:Uncharacterized protein n=1 Tax=Monopterus albus TaxID=43700 RepID=A0A3Q3ID10_MONAL